MLENAIYSILSPEGFASILYKDSSKAKEAAENMKLTAKDLKEFGVIDKIISEPENGAQNDFKRKKSSNYGSKEQMEYCLGSSKISL